MNAAFSAAARQFERYQTIFFAMGNVDARVGECIIMLEMWGVNGRMRCVPLLHTEAKFSALEM